MESDLAAEFAYWERYNQIVHVVRNPLDAVHSYWHLRKAMAASYTPEHPEGLPIDHTWKSKQEPLGTGPAAEAERAEVLQLAREWVLHLAYWTGAPLRTHLLRYEDLRQQPIAHLLGLLSFVLPTEDLPALDAVACVAEPDAAGEAYMSAKGATFASWDKYEPSLRREVLELVRAPFCAMGYGRLLNEVREGQLSMAGFCRGALEHPLGGSASVSSHEARTRQ